MLKARQQTQARFESFLQDAVAEDRCEVSICLILIIILETQIIKQPGSKHVYHVLGFFNTLCMPNFAPSHEGLDLSILHK